MAYYSDVHFSLSKSFQNCAGHKDYYKQNAKDSLANYSHKWVKVAKKN